MTLAPSFLLAPHFTAHELRADTPGIPGYAEANLFKTAAWLEAARAILGAPLTVTSGYRSPEHNASLPGASSTSDHMTGLAADWKPRGLSLYSTYHKLKAGPLPPFDQLIFYPVTGHIHVGLGARMRGEYRIALAEGGYPLITDPALLDKLGKATPWLLILIVVGLLYVASQKGA